MEQTDDQTWQAIRFAGYVQKSNLWPVDGGALDQSRWFLDAEQQIKHDKDKAMAQLMGE